MSLAGRKVNGRCVKPTTKNKRAKPCRRAINLTISYTLDSAANVTFTLKRTGTGRRLNGKCVALTHKNRHNKRCTRLTGIRGSLVKAGTAGANRFAWNANIAGRALGPGTYQLTATPAGGTPQTATFTIVG